MGMKNDLEETVIAAMMCRDRMILNSMIILQH